MAAGLPPTVRLTRCPQPVWPKCLDPLSLAMLVQIQSLQTCGRTHSYSQRQLIEPSVQLSLPPSPQVLQRLMGISGDYWRQYLSSVDNPDPQSPAPSAHSSPGMGSPSTPEQRPSKHRGGVYHLHHVILPLLPPVPESPFLGSCQSPRMQPIRTPVPAQ